MTEAQIRFHEYMETARHNRASEDLTASQQAETHRNNYELERIKWDANAIQRYGIDTSRQTALDTANIAADASRYSADRHYAGTVYAADSSRAASVYATNVSAQTALRTNAATVGASRYNTLASTTQTAARIASNERIQNKDLAYQREKLQTNNALTASSIALDRLNYGLNVQRTELEKQRTVAQVKQIMNDIGIVLQDYELRARAQNNADDLNAANVALTKLRAVESGTKSFDNLVHSVREITTIIKEVLPNVAQVQRQIGF
jgi:hypothetical protein